MKAAAGVKIVSSEAHNMLCPNTLCPPINSANLLKKIGLKNIIASFKARPLSLTKSIASTLTCEKIHFHKKIQNVQFDF